MPAFVADEGDESQPVKMISIPTMINADAVRVRPRCIGRLKSMGEFSWRFPRLRDESNDRAMSPFGMRPRWRSARHAPQLPPPEQLLIVTRDPGDCPTPSGKIRGANHMSSPRPAFGIICAIRIFVIIRKVQSISTLWAIWVESLVLSKPQVFWST